MSKTHEEHAVEHDERDRAVRAQFDDWVAHHRLWASIDDDELRWRLLDRPVRDFLAWSAAQKQNPVPLPGELHSEETWSAQEPCDAECGLAFGAGRERCRHLRTAEEWLRAR